MPQLTMMTMGSQLSLNLKWHSTRTS
jgi:hypothetical protein